MQACETPSLVSCHQNSILGGTAYLLPPPACSALCVPSLAWSGSLHASMLCCFCNSFGTSSCSSMCSSNKHPELLGYLPSAWITFVIPAA